LPGLCWRLWRRYPSQSHHHTINGFSAHADQAELIAWHEQTGASRTFLVHGDEVVMRSFATKLTNTRIETPALNETFDL
jgi:metallo-beta-lactamase family protein